MGSLKASELRIGNWVIFDGSRAEECRVDAHDLLGLVQCEKADEGSFFNPIPLTEEWLLKFGFKKTDNGLVFEHPAPNKPEDEHKDLGTLYPSFFFNKRPEVNKWMGCHTRVTIEYVHQLQNLFFCLCGEELTING